MITKNKIWRFLILFIAHGPVFQSCSSDNLDNSQDAQNPISTYQGNVTIDKEIRPYVNRFINEMNQRGLRLSTNRLSAELVNHAPRTHSDTPCGMGYWDYGVTGDPRIEILNTKGCWDRWSEIEKENLIFHELGHALLSKRHANNTMPNGSKQSLMCGNCNNYRVYNIYQNEQRSYYLDQLANNRIAVPDWALEKTFSRILDDDSFDYGIAGWTTKIAEHASFTQDPNNEIHYDFYVDDESLFSQPKALAIKTVSNSSAGTFAYWQKTFPVSDFENCSNVLLRADIITRDLTEGSAGIAIELLQKNAEGEFNYFAKYSNSIQGNGLGIINNENFEAQIVCLPKETEAIRILLFLYDGSESTSEITTATFDNLEIELYE